VVEATSIRRRVWGPKNRKRTAWVLNYDDQEGKGRRKTFKHRRNAEAFAEILRLLGDGSAFVDDDKLDYAIHQRDYYDEDAKPLTVRAIIRLIGKFVRTATRLSDAERAFFTTLVSDPDREGRDLIIEDRFLRAAIEGGKELKTYSYRIPDTEEDFGGWIGLYRFFGMYVVNTTQYGEGQEDFGPFANIKDGKAVFDAAIAWSGLHPVPKTPS
jgi:hypothetical protein